MKPIPAACAALSVLAIAGALRADESQRNELAAWLERSLAVERWDPAVVGWRKRDSSLESDLLALARDPGRTAGVRRRALEIAGAIDDRREAPLEIERSGQGEDLAAVASAASARAKTRLSALELLAREASREGSDARSAAESAESALEVAALARDPIFDPNGRRRALATLALPAVAKTAGLDAAKVALAILAETSPGDGQARAAALRVVCSQGSREAVVRALSAGALDDDEKVREAALDCAPALDDDASVQAFGRAVLGEHALPETRLRAVLALSRTGKKAAAPWLERALREAVPGVEDEARVCALVALARSRAREESEVVGPLVAILFGTRGSLDQRAIDGLSRLTRAGELVLAEVRARLQDPYSDETKERAAEVARSLGSKQLARELTTLARSDTTSPGARTAAVRALEDLGDPTSGAQGVASVLASARETPEAASLRRACAAALGSRALRGDAAREALARALSDDSPIVRVAALRSLGAQGDLRAAAPVALALARTGTAAERVEAISALAALSATDEATSASVAVLLRRDATDEVARAAASYLARAPRRVAVPALLDLLEHGDAQARALAHSSLLAVAGDAVEPTVDQGWDASPGARSERADVVKRWREWWRRNGER